MTVTGTKPLIEKLRKLEKTYPKATAAAVYQEGLAIDALSAQEVPVDTGRLRSTHYVAPPEDEDNPVCEVGYGTDYAQAVHDREELSHVVGKANYLRDPMNKRRRGWVQRMIGRIQKNAKRGIGVQAIPATAPKTPSES